jgi:hypothetical protein
MGLTAATFFDAEAAVLVMRGVTLGAGPGDDPNFSSR